MKKTIYLMFISALLMSCEVTKKATLINMESGERITATFSDNNGTGGKCQAIMPNGDTLVGTYTGIRGTDVISYGHSAGKINANTDYTSNNQNVLSSKTDANYSETGATRTVGGQGKAYALLYSKDPSSKLVMEIVAIYNVLGGGGFGDAKTNDGRKYKVIFE